MKKKSGTLKLRLVTFGTLAVVFAMVFSTQGCEKGSDTKISAHNKSESHNMGQNCMNCHKSGGKGEGWFNIAGTVYDTLLASTKPNATIKLYSGPNGTGNLRYTVEVDAKGNFYTTEKVDFGSGLYPSVTSALGNQRFMSTTITTGACNSCHNVSTDKINVN